MELAYIRQHLSIQVSHSLSLTHSQTNKLTLLNPSYFAWKKTQISKSNLWNWQGPSSVSLVSLDHFTASQERKGENKTVRISAIPTVIFITTTWVERKRETHKYCERGLSLQEVRQTNTCKIRFQSFRIQGHAESGEKENKQQEGKTKDNPKI